MEHEVGVDQPRLNMSLAQGCRLFGRILYVLILFFLLACIMILLIVLNRSGWFALLSGVFGALLYCTLTLPRVVFRIWKGARGRRENPLSQVSCTEPTHFFFSEAAEEPIYGSLSLDAQRKRRYLPSGSFSE